MSRRPGLPLQLTTTTPRFQPHSANPDSSQQSWYTCIGLYTIYNHNEDKRPRVHANCCVKNSYQNFGPPRPAGPPHCGVCGVTIYATAVEQLCHVTPPNTTLAEQRAVLQGRTMFMTVCPFDPSARSALCCPYTPSPKFFNHPAVHRIEKMSALAAACNEQLVFAAER